MEKIYNLKDKKDLRRKLRNDITKTEQLMWNKLRNRKLNGLKFHRQYGIGRYVVDFYCPSRKLVIEIDGGQHLEGEKMEYDKEREEYMRELGIRTLRFSNREVEGGIEEMLEKVLDEVK